MLYWSWREGGPKGLLCASECGSQLQVDTDCSPGAQAVLPVHPELVIVLPPIRSRLHQLFDVSAVCDEVCEVMWVFLCVDCQEVIPCSAPFGLCERAFALWCEVECWRAVIDEGHGVSRCVACV